MSRFPTAQNVIRTLILLNPDISTAEIEHELRGLGLKATREAIRVIKKGFKDTLKLLRQFNLLPEDETVEPPLWLKVRRSKQRRAEQKLRRAEQKLQGQQKLKHGIWWR